MSINEQMAAARAYIEAGQYDDARRILKKVDHPKAKEWLRKLNEKHPPKRTSSWKIVLLIVGIVIIVVTGVLYANDDAKRRARFEISRHCQENVVDTYVDVQQDYDLPVDLEYAEQLREECKQERGYYNIK